MYRIVIGDDDPIFLEQIAGQVERIFSADLLSPGRDFEIAAFADPAALRQKVLADRDCQLLLLDIDFAGESGMDLAKKLREAGMDCSLVYVSAYRDYVFDCFETRPLWYLVKPVDTDKLAEIIRRDYRERYEKNRLNLKIGGRLRAFLYEEIYALEAVSHRVRIWLRDGTSVDWNGPLSRLEPDLPGWCFCRCHNSYLVNLRHVTELMHTQVTMDNGAVFPVSRRYYASALNKYFAVLKH